MEATGLPIGAASRIRTFGELSRAVLLRSALLAVLLYFLLEAFQGSVDYAFLAVTVFVVVVMHEALHMVGMEALGNGAFGDFQGVRRRIRRRRGNPRQEDPARRDSTIRRPDPVRGLSGLVALSRHSWLLGGQ